MEKFNKKTLLLILCIVVAIVGRINGQTRLGLQYTKEELEIWRQRAVSGPYKSAGDVSANTPGDWDRIVSAKNKFMSNPAAGRWSGSSATGCVQQFAGNDPNKALMGNMQDAAFYALVKNDATVKQRVKTEILAQIKVPGVDFYNTKRWCRDVLKDVNPVFDVAIWGNQLLYTYEFVEDQFSDSEKQAVQKWFNGLAIYMQAEVDASLNKLFTNRGAARIEDYVYKGSNTKVNMTSANGHWNLPPALYYNNRRAHMIQLVGLVGIKYKNTSFVNCAKNFIRETIAFMFYPDGLFGELERIDAFPSRGLNYLTNTIGSMVMVADALARTGDFSMYDFKTKHGLGETKGTTEKSLQWAITQHGKYLDGSKKVYKRGGSVGNAAHLIDGTHPENNWIMMNDAPNFAIANIYYKNSFNKSVYMRTAPGIYPYPSKGLATNGSMSAWKGLAAHTAGLFMYGQMEGKVWPYPKGGSTPVEQNSSPTVSSGEDQTITLPVSTVTLEGTATDSDGSISSYKWTKVSGGDVVMSTQNEISMTLSQLKEGSYIFRLTATDDKGASGFDDVEVFVMKSKADPFILRFESSKPNCSILKDGRAKVIATGGLAPYSYKWSNGATTSEIFNLESGIFEVVVTDRNKDTVKGTVTIPKTVPITVSAVITNETGAGKDGEIDITVEGGTPDFSYHWSNGDIGQDLKGLNAGEFSLTVRDRKGCSISKTFVVGKEIKEDSTVENPREEENEGEEILAYKARKIFSPNNDNLGDETWIIENVNLIQHCSVTIMNESGKVVYQSNSYNNNWDGTINGREAPEGGYFYIIGCPDNSNSSSGSFRLVR